MITLKNVPAAMNAAMQSFLGVANVLRELAAGTVQRLLTTGTSVAGAITLNALMGRITTEALVTAALAEYTLTITNNLIAADDLVFVVVKSGTNTTIGHHVTSVVPAAGSVVIKIKNGHAASALNGTLKIDYLVVKGSTG